MKASLKKFNIFDEKYEINLLLFLKLFNKYIFLV